MDFKDSDGIEDDKYVIFKQDDLHLDSFPIMKEIRRQGKLCDVTLKVIDILVLLVSGKLCTIYNVNAVNVIKMCKLY